MTKQTTIPARPAMGRWMKGVRRLVPVLLMLEVTFCMPGASLMAQVARPGASVRDARDRAAQISPALAAARAAVDAAAGRQRQARAFPNPQLAYGHEQTSVGDATAAQDVVVVEQRFEIGGQPSKRVEAARLRRQAVEAGLAMTEADLGLEVARTFAQAVAAERRAVLADSATQRFNHAVRVMNDRLAAGDVSGYAARRLELEAARYAALAAEAQLAARETRVRLATLTGIPPDTALRPIQPTGNLADVLALPADSAAELAIANHAALRAARLTEQAARADEQLVRRERWPSPVASAGYKNERIPGRSGAVSGFVAGLSLSFPLWNRSAGSIAAAEAESSRLAAETDALRLRILQQTRVALEAARQAEARLDVLAPRLGAEATAALRAADTAFAEGEITLVEWLDAVRAYHEAESAYASVIADAIIQRATLERLLGVTLIG